MALLKQNTAVVLPYFLGPGLTTVTVNGLSKNGAAFAAPSDGAVTALGNGWYAVSWDATDTNTLGAFAVDFTAVIGAPVDPPPDQVCTELPGQIGPTQGAVTFGSGMVISNSAGAGLRLLSTGGNGQGVQCLGNGSGVGMLIQGGATANGITLQGGGTSGDGFSVTVSNGHGISIIATGTSKHGLFVTGGTAGTSDGIKAVAGSGGVDVRGNITGTVSNVAALGGGAITEASITLPTEATGTPAGALQLLMWLAGMFGWRKVVKDSTTIVQKMADGTTTKTTSTYTSAAGVDTINKAS